LDDVDHKKNIIFREISFFLLWMFTSIYGSSKFLQLAKKKKIFRFWQGIALKKAGLSPVSLPRQDTIKSGMKLRILGLKINSEMNRRNTM